MSDETNRPIPKSAFRPDIQGLRAIAIGVVLLAHARIPGTAGGFVGVDVFFVISGFLITGLLAHELLDQGRISFAGFYARRARRLLPMASIVLVATVLAAIVLYSPVQASLVAKDVFAAIAYVVNWRFAAESVDYFARGFSTSPVQHFWSLSIEEQFYIVWPAVMVIVTWVLSRRGADRRRTLLWTVSAITIASFIYANAIPTESGYFSTLARAWELGLGAMLALATPPPLSARTSSVLGWSGIGAIALATVLYTDETPFPGVAALLPCLGAAALLIAGSGRHMGSSKRLLGTAPARYVGEISYSWYLWHWPFLIFAAEAWGKLTPLEGAGVVALSLIPTVIGHHLIEEPLRRSRRLSSRPRMGLVVWASATGATLAAAAVLLAVQPSLPVVSSEAVAGAAVRDQGVTGLQRVAERIAPDPLIAYNDKGRPDDDPCFLRRDQIALPTGCEFGRPGSPTKVDLFGDSHAMMYFPALQSIAQQRGWGLRIFAKAGCFPGGPYEEEEACVPWSTAAIDEIVDERPAMVIVSGEMGERDPLQSILARFHDAGIRAVVIKDVPHAPVGVNIPSCVSESLDHLSACAFENAKRLNRTFENRAADAVPGTTLIDLADLICPRHRCQPVIGDALVYRDDSHLTATFVRTLTPALDRLIPGLGRVSPPKEDEVGAAGGG